MQKVIIYLVRHAEPDWSRTDISYYVPPGPPLTSQGLVEARALGAFLHAAGVRKVYTSPLERSWHTAQVACEVLSAHGTVLQPVVSEALMEWQPGEVRDDIIQRMRPMLDAAAAESLALGPVALVSHGGPIAMMLEDLGLSASDMETYRQQFDHRNPLPTGGAWEALRNGMDWELRLAFTP